MGEIKIEISFKRNFKNRKILNIFSNVSILNTLFLCTENQNQDVVYIILINKCMHIRGLFVIHLMCIIRQQIDNGKSNRSGKNVTQR